MPGMDGTGPLGLGSRTGRAYGYCDRGRFTGRKPGFFRYSRSYNGGYSRRGFGRGFCRFFATDSKEALTARKQFLQDQLSAIEEQLTGL